MRATTLSGAGEGILSIAKKVGRIRAHLDDNSSQVETVRVFDHELHRLRDELDVAKVLPTLAELSFSGNATGPAQAGSSAVKLQN